MLKRHLKIQNQLLNQADQVMIKVFRNFLPYQTRQMTPKKPDTVICEYVTSRIAELLSGNAEIAGKPVVPRRYCCTCCQTCPGVKKIDPFWTGQGYHLYQAAERAFSNLMKLFTLPGLLELLSILQM